MSVIRKPGKINAHTTLIDIGMHDIYGLTAVYLIQGARRSCLIDGGTRLENPRLVKKLTELGAFPPDLIIATHPHWDHAQGIPWLRRAASSQGKKIEVLASPDAIPLLADAAFNNVYDYGPYESIREVTPVKEGDLIDLGGIGLRIYDVPGHCQGHIAILDEQNSNLFVGDSLGIKASDDIFLPPFMPPTWDPDAFLASINKMKQIPYQTLCLAHFGCVSGGEARSILEESLETYKTWWQWYEQNADHLNDPDYMLRAMRKEMKIGKAPIRPVTFKLKVLSPLMIAFGTVTGRLTAMTDKLVFSEVLTMLANGYRMYHKMPPMKAIKEVSHDKVL